MLYFNFKILKVIFAIKLSPQNFLINNNGLFNKNKLYKQAYKI